MLDSVFLYWGPKKWPSTYWSLYFANLFTALSFNYLYILSTHPHSLDCITLITIVPLFKIEKV